MAKFFKLKQSILLTIILIIPIFLWLIQEPLGDRFSSSAAILLSLGRLAALEGLMLFALTIILTSRIKIIENIFFGLNRAFVSHHNYGGIAFTFLLLHPVLLAVRYLFTSATLAMNFLLPSLGNIPRLFGTLALSMMIVILFITFYLKIKYNIWKFLHKFMGVSFMLAFVHIYLIPSDISRNMFLRYYILFWAVLAIAAYLYRVIFNEVLVKKYNYVVESVRPLTQNIIEIILKPVQQKIIYQPGQFAFFSFDQSKFTEQHPFSFTSNPGENNVAIAVKALGDYSQNMSQIQVGTKCLIEGPYGRFSYTYAPNKDQVWIAGGIGITPFISMARSLPSDFSQHIDLYYSLKNEQENVFIESLFSLSKTNSHLKFTHIYSDQVGHLTAEAIMNKTEDITKKEIFICGPKAMMRSLKEQFIASGVDKDQIHTEEFAL